jgi:hypothetical protein
VEFVTYRAESPSRRPNAQTADKKQIDLDRDALKQTLKSVLIELEQEKVNEKVQDTVKKAKVVVPKLNLGDNLSTNSKYGNQIRPETVLSTKIALKQPYGDCSVSNNYGYMHTTPDQQLESEEQPSFEFSPHATSQDNRV